jgi:predicted phosphoadenosine phosphosulfate sulfurtransferase
MENLLVSFSGGETSAFMSQWLNRHYGNLGYKNIVFVFANTGIEHEETYSFIQKCQEHFNFTIQWVEAHVNYNERKSTGYWLTDYDNARRDGKPFEAVIKKYGIPNIKFPHCTRELKENPIKAFAKDWFDGERYDTAIGIRQDEFDRMNSKAKQLRFIYPLIDSNMIPATKPMINFYWRQMPFRLNLKSYQGNCITCWKKSDKKLYRIAKENPEAFNFFRQMENKYSFINEEQYTFFRKNRFVDQLIEEAKQDTTNNSLDDSQQFDYQLDLLNDSCEIFSECK